MKTLKVEKTADNDVQQVTLRGDHKNPDPLHLRVRFPGGDVVIARCTDGSYWVHVRAERPGNSMDDGEGPYGRILEGRADLLDKHAAEVDPGLIGNPNLYHLAVRVGIDPDAEPRKRKIYIGDVLVHVGEPRDGNPYATLSLIGKDRSDALVAFRDGGDVSRYTYWHGPSHGGARRITDPAEVDWTTMRGYR